MESDGQRGGRYFRLLPFFDFSFGILNPAAFDSIKFVKAVVYVLLPRFDPAGFRSVFLLGKRRRDVFFFSALVDGPFSFEGQSVLATALSTSGD